MQYVLNLYGLKQIRSMRSNQIKECMLLTILISAFLTNAQAKDFQYSMLVYNTKVQ
jgi:hypothetical protein